MKWEKVLQLSTRTPSYAGLKHVCRKGIDRFHAVMQSVKRARANG